MAEAAAREHATAVADIRGQHARAFEVMWMELHQHMEARTTEHKARLVRARQHEKKQTEHQRSVEEVLSEERAKHARKLASLTGVHESKLAQQETAHEHIVEERLSEEPGSQIMPFGRWPWPPPAL